jgi:predicted ATP-grasp superfamily ATP-dependent carboligase
MELVHNTKVVILGYNADTLHAINQAIKLGFRVVIFANDLGNDEFNPNIEKHNIDIKKKTEIISCLLNYDFVTLPTPIGRYITTLGAINDHFKLRGVSEKCALLVADKLLFDLTLRQIDERNASTSLLTPESEYDINIKMVIKPRFGSGSKGVYFINNLNHFKLVHSKLISEEEEYIIERRFDGDEYGLDAIVIDGLLYILSIRKKIIHTYSHFVIGYMTIAAELFQRYKTILEAKFKRVIDHLGIIDSLLHADIMISEDDINIIEMSTRPSGHYIYDVFLPLITGMDVISEYLKAMLGYKANLVYNYNSFVGLFFFDDEMLSPLFKIDILGLKEKFVDSLIDIRVNKLTDQSISTQIGIVNRGYFIIKGYNESSLIKIRQDLINAIENINEEN